MMKIYIPMLYYRKEYLINAGKFLAYKYKYNFTYINTNIYICIISL